MAWACSLRLGRSDHGDPDHHRLHAADFHAARHFRRFLHPAQFDITVWRRSRSFITQLVVRRVSYIVRTTGGHVRVDLAYAGARNFASKKIVDMFSGLS
jgi:hypothetical protein